MFDISIIAINPYITLWGLTSNILILQMKLRLRDITSYIMTKFCLDMSDSRVCSPNHSTDCPLLCYTRLVLHSFWPCSLPVKHKIIYRWCMPSINFFHQPGIRYQDYPDTISVSPTMVGPLQLFIPPNCFHYCLLSLYSVVSLL